MAYDDGLAERIREELSELTTFDEKRMFGGLAFMVRGNMCVGVVRSDLMARVGPLHYDSCQSWPGARLMDFTGRPMRGMLFVGADALADDAVLRQWLQQCLSFVRTLPDK